MSKKQGKGRFRHTKKNVLHKKRVNTKKRGLRGGMFNLFKSTSTSTSTSTPAPASANTTQPPVKFSNLIDKYGTLHGITGRFSTSVFLSDKNCTEYMAAIDNYETTNRKLVNLVPGSAGIRDYNQCLTKLGIAVTFDTSLTTKKTNKKLTLNGCKAIKKNIDETNGHFKYEIFSPAASTEPPSGGTPSEIHVGTFTQLPISYLLQMAAGKEIRFNYESFYEKNEERKPYSMDYLSCLKNVQERFGPDAVMKSSQLQKFQESSKLRQFGKDMQCKIVLVAGNVGTEIQDPVNDGAIFVLPSQFNGAEYPSPSAITDLNKYKIDPTGGPLGQLSCHPAVATFILNYAARSGFNSDFLVINALEPNASAGAGVKNTIDIQNGVSAGLTLNNGYLEVKGSNGKGDFNSSDFDFYRTGGISLMACSAFNSFCRNLKVLQTDDVPTNGLTPANEYTSFNSSAISKVSLVYASAVPLQYGVNINPEKSKLQYCVAGFDLVAQYFGAMVSAYNKSKKSGHAEDKKVKLFLTPVGGGVFSNPREMIACSALLAYYQAQQLFTDFDASVEVIFLVWDGSEAECKDFIEFFNEDGSVERAIEQLKQEAAAKAAAKAAAEAAAQREVEEERVEKERAAVEEASGKGGVSPGNAPGNNDDSDSDDDTYLPRRLNKEEQQALAAPGPRASTSEEQGVYTPAPTNPLGDISGGSKSRRKPAHKTRRGRKSKSKSKPKTHRRRHHSRTRNHKKYTRKH